MNNSIFINLTNQVLYCISHVKYVFCVVQHFSPVCIWLFGCYLTCVIWLLSNTGRKINYIPPRLNGIFGGGRVGSSGNGAGWYAVVRVGM